MLQKPYLVRKVTNIPLDSYIVVNGTVNKRPKHQRNTVSNYIVYYKSLQYIFYNKKISEILLFYFGIKLMM